jgi:hypothetical protein
MKEDKITILLESILARLDEIKKGASKSNDPRSDEIIERLKILDEKIESKNQDQVIGQKLIETIHKLNELIAGCDKKSSYKDHYFGEKYALPTLILMIFSALAYHSLIDFLISLYLKT